MSESFSWAPQAQVLPIDAWINLRRVNQKGCKLTTKIHSTIVSILVCLLSNMKGENLTGHRPNSHVKIGTIREGHSLGIPSSSHKSTQSRPKYRKSSSAALRCPPVQTTSVPFRPCLLPQKESRISVDGDGDAKVLEEIRWGFHTSLRDGGHEKAIYLWDG